MDWKTMLADVTGSVDENLLLRIAYLVAENRILRDQLKSRVYLSDGVDIGRSRHVLRALLHQI